MKFRYAMKYFIDEELWKLSNFWFFKPFRDFKRRRFDLLLPVKRFWYSFGWWCYTNDLLSIEVKEGECLPVDWIAYLKDN